MGANEGQVDAVEQGEEDRLGEPERTVVAFTREVVRDVRASDAALHAVVEAATQRGGQA